MFSIRRATPLPKSSDGNFYAINNPFQIDGPKGYTECKMIGLSDMFVRIDLPGVGQNDFSATIDDSRKGVIIKASAPSLDINDSFPRSYEAYIRLYCDCCKISRFHNLQVTDGVLRLIISMTPITSDRSPSEALHRYLHDTDPNDPAKTGPMVQPHPFVTQGPDTAYVYKQLPDGGAYVRLDMPGIPSSIDNCITYVQPGRVYVVGHAPAVSHDSSGRSYSADAALLYSRDGKFPTPRLRSILQNGVMRLFIHPF